MEKATLTVEIDAHVKEQAAKLFDQMGYNHDEAIAMFYRQVVFYGRLPFETSEPQPVSKETADKLSATIQHLMETGKTRIIDLDVNEKGEAIIDKDQHPRLYDWAVNG